MKKFLSDLGIYALLILLVPILVLMLIGYLIFVPFDIIRYHTMPYYKDLKYKYQFFITSRAVVKIYNRIVTEKLPVQYVRNNDYEYFIKESQVLLCEVYDDFILQDSEYFFVVDDQPICKISEALEDEIAQLKPEHQNLPAKFLIVYDDVVDSEKFEQAKECPYFQCIYSLDEKI